MALQRLSVIIPNFNRADALRETLHSLDHQTLEPDSFEVLVVDDGSTDGSISLLKGLGDEVAFPLRLITQKNLGPGAARNRGAEEASSDLLLFWDSDMVAAATTLEIHRDLHLQNRSALASGARRAWAPATTSLFDEILKADQVGQDHMGEAPSFWEALSSNLSIHRLDFCNLGGFDENLWAFEDTDLAYRALQAGLALLFSREAIGYHNHPLTLDQACLHQRSYQRYAAAFLAKHPELQGEIGYLKDKDPIHLGSDPVGLVVRKAVRQIIALPPVLSLLKALIPPVERHYPDPRLLSFLYWKILASFQLIGYREGLREFA
jgi:GT2 family glycosyltransferase